jgi:hypothetical protein
LNDLNEAVEASRGAESNTDNPGRHIYLSNLADTLGRRFERTGSLDDLEIAMEAIEEALSLCPKDHLYHVYLWAAF